MSDSDLRSSAVDLDGGYSVDPVRQYLSEVGRYPLLTPQQELDLARRMERGDRTARDLFIASNLRLVIKIARKYSNRGLDLLDRIQHGNAGLIKAASRFDWRRGFKFSTMAHWWIESFICRAVADEGSTIRAPIHAIETTNKFRRLLHFTNKDVNDLTDEDLAKAKLTRSDAEMSWSIMRQAELVSLDEPVRTDGDEVSMHDSLQDPNATNGPDEFDATDAHDAVAEALQYLTPSQRRVIELRFGLNGQEGQTHTLEEVAALFGVPREKIRQLERKALDQLKSVSAICALAGRPEPLPDEVGPLSEPKPARPRQYDPSHDRDFFDPKSKTGGHVSPPAPAVTAS